MNKSEIENIKKRNIKNLSKRGRSAVSYEERVMQYTITIPRNIYNGLMTFMEQEGINNKSLITTKIIEEFVRKNLKNV